MNLGKRLLQISAVAVAVVFMYEGALSLENTREANVTLKTNAVRTTEPNSSEKTSTSDDVSKSQDTENSSDDASKSQDTENSSDDASKSQTTESTSEHLGEAHGTESASETTSETEALSSENGSEEISESELASEGLEIGTPTDGLYEYTDGSGSYRISSQYLLLPSFQDLRKDLNDMIADYEGSWSIYVKDLKSSISLTINDRPQDSASLIKLYIAGAVLEEIRDKNLEETETIDRLLSDMISLSDNEAANELVRYLSDNHEHQDGLMKVNQFIDAHNYNDTHQYNGLEDSNLWYGDEVNVTSVKDCGRFLEEIYDGNMVNHLASRQLEGYLLDQDITWKIPAGIPSEIKTANKTGEKDNTQNDVSIVYTPYRDYILCVMATNLTDEDTAVEHIREISKEVYEFFLETDVRIETEASVDDGN